MALPHLTDEQIRDWTREQKDRWWLQNVFRGDMPQLTLRAAATGFLLGGVLCATNLYVAAKTGWTLGVGLTSVILAFAMFSILSRLGARDMTILENNCMQSIATAAGYMTMPLTSGIAAYMWATNDVLPWWQIMCFNVVLSSMGVLVAFPMKRRFINDEQHPFPEGRACGVVLDALYESAGAAAGMYKARVLAAAAGIAGTIGVLSGENIMRLVQQKWLGLASAWHLPLSLDGWYYALAEKGLAPLPRLAGVDLRQLALSPSLDLAMIGAGGLMGIRTASSLLVGAIAQLRRHRADHDHGGRDRAARGLDRGRHRGLRTRAHPQHLVAVVGHHDDGGRGDGDACSRGRRCSSRRGGCSPGAARPHGARRRAARTSSCRSGSR